MINYFKLLDIPEEYLISLELLEEHFQRLALLYHPDKVALHNTFEKKSYLRMFTTLNEAYQTLKNPIKRAEHWLYLNQVPYDPEATVQADSGLLELQLAWREKIENITTTMEASPLEEELQTKWKQLLVALGSSLEKKAWVEAVALLGEAKFFMQLRYALRAKVERLGGE
ncbi:MAG: Fe-S protein assembly co-chaperone HscB [Neisseriaceae bacterium]